MPRQIADDPGRQHRKVWLGAEGHRWAWDWEYDEWIVAFGAFTIGGTLLTWVVPSGVVAGYLTYRLARWVSTSLNPDAPKTYFRTVLACGVGLCLLYSANPITWLLPIWLPLALAGSFLLPWLAVRRVKIVDWNRPLAYWLRLPFQVARGPRQQNEDVIDPTRLMLEADLDSEEIGPIEQTVQFPTWAGPASLTWRTSKPPVAARITPAPKARPVRTKVDPVEKRLVPIEKGQHGTKFIERTPGGIRIGNTEYRVEGRY